MEWIRLWPSAPPSEAPLRDVNETHRDGTDGFERIWNVGTPALAAFPARPAKRRPALLILPGGGLHHLAWEKEGVDVARRRCAAGRRSRSTLSPASGW